MTKRAKRLSEWRQRSASLEARAALLDPGEERDRLLRLARQLKSASEAAPLHARRGTSRPDRVSGPRGLAPHTTDPRHNDAEA